MKAIWNWIGSPSYWKSAAIIHALYITIAALGKTGDWTWAAVMLLSFYVFWELCAEATEAAHDKKVKLALEALEAMKMYVAAEGNAYAARDKANAAQDKADADIKRILKLMEKNT